MKKKMSLLGVGGKLTLVAVGYGVIAAVVHFKLFPVYITGTAYNVTQMIGIALMAAG